jgi:signal transduction histidine kinase
VPAAREIHDGLAQYLFAADADELLAGGAPGEDPTAAAGAAAAQQEARFAVLALSRQAAPRPSIRRARYVEFLTQTGN